MKKKIAALGCVLALALSVLSGCGGTNTATSSTAKPNTSSPAAQTEKVTPTLMYFISGSDETFDEEKTVIDELQGEYGEKVNINVINIDENAEAANNFPVQGNTPMVIMLNTNNDISALNPKISDKNELTKIIENALTE